MKKGWNLSYPIERTAKALKRPRLNLLEAFNVIAIKLVVILNHFPGDKTVFYGIYLTLFMFVLMQFSLSKVRTWYYNIQQILLSDMINK